MLPRRQNYSIDQQTQSRFPAVAAWSLAIAILSFVSPQIGIFGHELRTTLPALTVAAVAISLQSPRAFAHSWQQFRIFYVLGFFYLLQAGLRFVFIRDAENLWHTFFESPLETLIVVYCIAGLSELGSETVLKFKYLVLFGWCLSLALGLPTLFDLPGIARKTMGNIFAAENAARWGPLGVGEYTTYTSFAICLGPLFVVLKKKSGILKLLGGILVFLASVAVVMSTFTMAAVILIISILGLLLMWAKDERGLKRVLRVAIIVMPIAMLPLLYSQAGQYEQTKYIVTKVERLYQGFAAAGIAKGDETKRGEWFIEEMKSFSDEPFLGYIPKVTGQLGYGHSSLSNSLVLFGIFGAGLWVGAVASLFYRCYQRTEEGIARSVILLCGLVLFASGILNPIWHSRTALCAVFALILSAPRSDNDE